MRSPLAVLLLLTAPLASGQVAFTNPWSRATPPNSSVGVVYVTVRASAGDQIVSMSSSAAERVEMHTTVNDGGTMKMRAAPTVTLPPNKPVQFESGGLHIMLIGLRAPLRAGTHIELTVNFRASGSETLRVPVIGPTEPPPKR